MNEESICRTCNGTGRSTHRKCPGCGGTGTRLERVICPNCGGDGQIDLKKPQDKEKEPLIGRIQKDFEFDKKVSRLRVLIYNEKLDEAREFLKQLKSERAEDKRIPVFEKWINKEQQDMALRPEQEGLGGDPDFDIVKEIKRTKI